MENQLTDGDRVLLCSDGLHGAITADTITAALSAEPDIDVAAERLLREVLHGAANDNISVLLIRYAA